MKTLFVVNPAAGRGKTQSRWSAFERLLRKNAPFPFDVHFTTRAGEAEGVSMQAIRSGFDRLIAVGGDGTANEMINGVLGSDILLGVLPFGTGNDLARSLGVMKSGQDLLRMLCCPKEASLNVANINGRHFINAAGIGFDGMVANDINHRTFLKNLGALGYAVSAVKVLSSFVPSEVELTVDGYHTILPRVWMIAIGNCPFYGGGMKICPFAKYDDDWLDVCIVSNLSSLSFLQTLPSVYSGGHVRKKSCIAMQRARHIEITGPEYMIAHADGEIISSSSLRVDMSEQRVRFLTG